MWEVDYNESWAQNNWCFWTVGWRRLLRVPWTARRSNQSILKEISPGCSLVGLMLSWNSNTLATWWEELTHWKRSGCWEGLGAGGEGDDRGWDGWMASLVQWTRVWVYFRSWWWTGRPACCSSWGCKESDTTEWLNWTETSNICLCTGDGDSYRVICKLVSVFLSHFHKNKKKVFL